MSLRRIQTHLLRKQKLISMGQTSWRQLFFRIARVACLFVIVGSLGLFGATLPLHFHSLERVCANAACRPPQLSASDAVQLEALGISLPLYATLLISLMCVTALICVSVVLLLLWQKSENWMALLISLLLTALGLGIYDERLLGSLLGSGPAMILAAFFSFLFIASTLLVFALFPNGRFVPGWTRWLALVGIALVMLLSIPFPLFDASFLSFLIWISCLLLLAAAQIYRFRRVSSPDERQKSKWVIFGMVLFLLTSLAILLPSFFIPTIGSLYNLIAYLVGSYSLALSLALSLGIALLRSNLYDIEILLSRTLVYGALTFCVMSIYMLVVLSLSALFESSGNLLFSLVATALVAVLFQPLRERIQSGVNRLLYGERDTPYQVISRLGQRLEATLAPLAILPIIVETVAQALKLPYAAITLQQEGTLVVAASYGEKQNELERLPLVYQGEMIGEMLLATRSPGEPLTAGDRVLLSDLARQAGVAIYATRITVDLQHLTQELQQSRTLLVSAREEERRRLRRDLHDGLGPTLGALTIAIGSARYLSPRNPAAAEALLEKIERDIAQTVTEIRRLVYALRPPVLDEHGLVAAIRECAVQSRILLGEETASASFTLAIDAPDPFPALPAAVEVAAYRIAQEALTNVARHARAQNCMVRLLLSDTLELEITDDGIGLPEGHPSGVGLLSMRERALELGGQWEVQQAQGGGTRLTARLPVPAAPPRTLEVSSSNEALQEGDR